MLNWNESVWFAMLVSLTLKNTAVLGVACLSVFLLRRGSAAARHLVWTTAAAAILALPFFSASLPVLPVPAPGALVPNIRAVFQTTATAGRDGSIPASQRTTTTGQSQPTPWFPDWRLLLMLTWAMGGAAALVHMLVACARLCRVRQTANPSPDRHLTSVLAGRLGLLRSVDVLETAEGTMPMTFGIMRPAIFMPRDAAGWTEERRCVVLLHELAHVRRGDVATHLIARLALVLNWWNPVAWVAWHEFLTERERATDDLVLHAGARASDYASHLLEVARTMQVAPALASAAVAMARRSQLETRLVAILDSRVNRKTMGGVSAIAAVLLAVVIVAPLAALRAQDSAPRPMPRDVDATIRAATAQKNPEMLERPATASEDLRQYDTAKKLLESAVAIREQLSGDRSVDYGVGLVKLGDLEKKRGRRGEAEAFYSKAVQVLGYRSEASPALMFLAIDMFVRKDFEAAIDNFQRTQNVDPSQTGAARMWMALVREREQKPEEADAMYRAALALESPESTDAATTMELYGRFLKEQGRQDESKLTLDRAAAVRKTREAKFRPRESNPNALRIGGGITPPKVISKMEPEYTEEARAAKYQGTAVIYVEVGTDGFAHNITAARGLGLGLDENAVKAVSMWKFQPATKDGVPVIVQANIEVNFRLM